MKAHTQRRSRAVVLEVENVQYEIHLGRPGRPKIYRRVGAFGNLRRVTEQDPVLPKIAVEFRRQVDSTKKRDLRWQMARFRHWIRRLLARIGRLLARLRAWWRSRWRF